MAIVSLGRIVVATVAFAVGVQVRAQPLQADSVMLQGPSGTSGAGTSEAANGLPPDSFPAPTAPSSSLDAAQNQNDALTDEGKTAETGAGEVGQRQTFRDVAAQQNALDRINNRISNRVENRLRNRIDRNYDPTANAKSPFEDASKQAPDLSQPR